MLRPSCPSTARLHPSCPPLTPLGPRTGAGFAPLRLFLLGKTGINQQKLQEVQGNKPPILTLMVNLVPSGGFYDVQEGTLEVSS